MKNTLEALHRRYATKKYDTTKKLSDEQVNTILEAMRLAPSSFGLEPWKFVVVTNPEIREKLKAASRGQSPITDASHIIVLTAQNTMTQDQIQAYVDNIIQTRGVTAESVEGYKQMMIGAVQGIGEANIPAWNSRQLYIPFGIALLHCAQNGIDATPMEGFDPNAYNQILGLDGYSAVAVLAIGYRSENDSYKDYAKVRFPSEKVIQRVK